MNEPIHTTTFIVGAYRCTIAFPALAPDAEPGVHVGMIKATWEPEPGPTWSDLTRSERAQYIAGRDAGVRVAAELTGAHILTVGAIDVPPMAEWPGVAIDLPEDQHATDGGVLEAFEVMMHVAPISQLIIDGRVPEPRDLYTFARAVEEAVLERVLAGRMSASGSR